MDRGGTLGVKSGEENNGAKRAYSRMDCVTNWYRIRLGNPANLWNVRRLTWKAHVSSKRKQLDLKAREIKCVIGRHSPYHLKIRSSFTKQFSNQCGRMALNYGAVLQTPI